MSFLHVVEFIMHPHLALPHLRIMHKWSVLPNQESCVAGKTRSKQYWMLHAQGWFGHKWSVYMTRDLSSRYQIRPQRDAPSSTLWDIISPNKLLGGNGQKRSSHLVRKRNCIAQQTRSITCSPSVIGICGYHRSTQNRLFIAYCTRVFSGHTCAYTYTRFSWCAPSYNANRNRLYANRYATLKFCHAIKIRWFFWVISENGFGLYLLPCVILWTVIYLYVVTKRACWPCIIGRAPFSAPYWIAIMLGQVY